MRLVTDRLRRLIRQIKIYLLLFMMQFVTTDLLFTAQTEKILHDTVSNRVFYLHYVNLKMVSSEINPTAQNSSIFVPFSDFFVNFVLL